MRLFSVGTEQKHIRAKEISKYKLNNMNYLKRAGALAVISSLAFLYAPVASAEEVAVATPVAITIAAAGPAAVGSTLEAHINNDGSVLLRGAKVTAIAASSLTVTQTWGSYVSTWTVNVEPSTELIRRYGGVSSLSEFSVGDYVATKGMLDTTKVPATINAKVIRDYSIQRENATFTGTVLSVDAGAQSFVLTTPNRGNQAIFVSSSTVVKQGGATTTFASLAVGQKISKATGVWNNLNNTMQSQKVDIYQNTALLNKRTFEGTLKSMSATTSLPTTLVMTVGSADFTVNIPLGISVIGKNWLALPLSAFVVGDKVRVYGAVQPANTSVIDASIVRDAIR